MIRFEKVSKRYGNGAYAVDNLDLQIDAGELCVLVGPSGGGKTTVLRMVNRLVEPTSGRVLVAPPSTGSSCAGGRVMSSSSRAFSRT
jgi:osmoprotectant transport system ATP-binding protein